MQADEEEVEKALEEDPLKFQCQSSCDMHCGCARPIAIAEGLRPAVL